MIQERKNLTAVIQRLEKIVEEMSQGELDIEKGLEKFREAVDLIKFCRGELKNAENEFKKLKASLEPEDEE